MHLIGFLSVHPLHNNLNYDSKKFLTFFTRVNVPSSTKPNHQIKLYYVICFKLLLIHRFPLPVILVLTPIISPHISFSLRRFYVFPLPGESKLFVKIVFSVVNLFQISKGINDKFNVAVITFNQVFHNLIIIV